MSIPKILQYGNVKPRGYATTYKRWTLNPQASYNTFNNNELIRFSMQTDSWIDPYASFIEIQVTTNSALMSDDGLLELDGASTSLINEMVIYSDSKEIERISEYD